MFSIIIILFNFSASLFYITERAVKQFFPENTKKEDTLTLLSGVFRISIFVINFIALIYYYRMAYFFI